MTKTFFWIYTDAVINNWKIIDFQTCLPSIFQSLGDYHYIRVWLLHDINRRLLKNYHSKRIRQLHIWINKLRSSKKQPNENAIYNLLSEKLKEIAINNKQLTERLNYLVEMVVLQNKLRNGANSFYITNN